MKIFIQVIWEPIKSPRKNTKNGLLHLDTGFRLLRVLEMLEEKPLV